MSKHTHLGDAVMGMITTVTLGSWLFQVFSVFVLAIIGALGGWIFAEFIKPQLQKLLKKKKEKAQ